MRLQKMISRSKVSEEKPSLPKKEVGSETKEEEIPPEIPPEELGEEFDIPAFLRRGH